MLRSFKKSYALSPVYLEYGQEKFSQPEIKEYGFIALPCYVIGKKNKVINGKISVDYLVVFTKDPLKFENQEPSFDEDGNLQNGVVVNFIDDNYSNVELLADWINSKFQGRMKYDFDVRDHIEYLKQIDSKLSGIKPKIKNRVSLKYKNIS